MSRNSNNPLIAPTPETPKPINHAQISRLINTSKDRDMVFYEYEIVDKEQELKAGSRLATRFGYCMCRRWLFLLVGNAILVGLIMAICGILLYVNTVQNVPVKPLGYLSICTPLSSNCDSLRHLECSSSGLCVCQTNMFWNGTDCDCVFSSQYFDGLTWFVKHL